MTCSSMTWQAEAPPVFTLAKGELPDLSPYPVRLVDANGSVTIRHYAGSQIPGLKPYQSGLQTCCLKKNGADGSTLSLPISVVYTDIRLDRLSIHRYGKRVYSVGEQFDLNGYLVDAHYSDGSRKSVPAVCLNPTIQEGQKRVPLVYGCKTCHVPITVLPRQAEKETPEPPASSAVVGIRIARPPKKNVYLAGFVQVDLREGILEVDYDSGETRQFPMEGMTAVARCNQVGETDITILFAGRAVSYPVQVVEPKVLDLKILSMPARLDYEEEENLDLTGLSLQITCNDGSIQELRNLQTNCQLRLDDRAITLSCLGYPFTIPVQVRPKKPVPLRIQVTKLPDRTSYQIRETLDPSGGEITVFMSNGTEQVLPLQEASLSGFCSDSAGPVEILVRVLDLECRFQVEILPRTLLKLEVQGSMRDYIDGELYETDDLWVYAIYSNGDRDLVPDYQLNRSVADVSDHEVVISYQGVSARVPVRVLPPSPVVLRLLHLPNCLEYMQGDTRFRCDGGVLEITYSNGDTEERPLQNSDLSGYDPDRPGTQTISVTAEGLTATFDVTVHPAVPVELQVLQMPRTDYREGECFSSEGMQVVCTLSNGQTKDVTRETTVCLDRPLLSTDTLVLVVCEQLAAAIPVQVTATGRHPCTVPGQPGGFFPLEVVRIPSAPPRSVQLPDPSVQSPHSSRTGLPTAEPSLPQNIPKKAEHPESIPSVGPAPDQPKPPPAAVQVPDVVVPDQPRPSSAAEQIPDVVVLDQPKLSPGQNRPWVFVPFYPSTVSLRFES